MAILDTTPGGVVLPLGTPLGTVLPDLHGTQSVSTGVGVVELAPSAPPRTDGPLISYQDVYETNATISAPIDKISRNAARVPIRLWRRPRDEEGVVQEVHDHAILDLLNEPAPGCGWVETTQWLFHPPLKHGNGLIGKIRGNGADKPPTELFPLDWRYISAYRYPAGRVALWVTTEGTQVRYLKPRELVHVAWDSGQGGLGQIGISPLRKLGAPIAVDDAALRHNFSQLANGVHSGVAFELPPGVDVTPELTKGLRDTLDALAGVDKAGGVPMLLGGAKLVAPGQQTAEEAQIIGVREQSREDVCMVYDTSPVALGLLKDASQRGNVAELLKDFFGNTMPPWFALGANAIKRQLIDVEPEWREERLFVTFDASEFTRGDPLAWAQAQEIEVRSGGITLDERRKANGRQPYRVPGSDEPILSDNNYHPLSQIVSGAVATAAQRASAVVRRAVGRDRQEETNA
jgi:HK97 family phage portal protein